MADLLALADPETAALWRDLRLGYTEAPGHPLLRAEIATLYDTIATDEVLVFSGAEEAIFVTANVLLGSGDHAIVAWPAYQSLHEVARATGADVTLHELREENGWAIDLDVLRSQVTPAYEAHRRQRPATTPRATSRMPPRTGPSRRSPRMPAPRSCATRSTGSSSTTGSTAFRPARTRSARRQRRRDEQVVRAGRPAHRLARDPRRGAAGPRHAVQGLHDDLRLGAGRDPVADRVAGSRTGPGALPRDRRRATSPCSTPSSSDVPARSAGCVRAAVRSASPSSPPAVPVDRFAQGLLEAEGVLIAPASIFGHPGNHFRLGFGRTDLPVALAGLEAFLDRTLGPGS